MQTLTPTRTSHARNKLIAEAFYLTNNIEKHGSGFIRIRKELAAYPALSLRIEEIGDGVLLSLQHSEGVNEGVSRLYRYITEKPGIRTPELSGILSMPPKTLERWLKQLRQDGRIVFKGAPKTGGYYIQESVEK